MKSDPFIPRILVQYLGMYVGKYMQDLPAYVRHLNALECRSALLRDCVGGNKSHPLTLPKANTFHVFTLLLMSSL